MSWLVRELREEDAAAKTKAVEPTPDYSRSLANAVLRNIDDTTPGGYRPRTKFPGLVTMIVRVWIILIIVLGISVVVSQTTRAAPTVGRLP